MLIPRVLALRLSGLRKGSTQKSMKGETDSLATLAQQHAGRLIKGYVGMMLQEKRVQELCVEAQDLLLLFQVGENVVERLVRRRLREIESTEIYSQPERLVADQNRLLMPKRFRHRPARSRRP